MEYEFHEVASIFPLMLGEEYLDLVADIRANGLREPIWLHDGKIIDGRNRYRACQDAGIEPRFRTWDGTGSLVAFVVSLNLHRRHLTESQRAMVASKLSTMSEGRPNKTASIEAVSQTQAAELLNVSRSAVQRAKQVEISGIPQLIQAVDEGRVSVSAASIVATTPQSVQEQIVSRGDKEIVAAAKEIREQGTPSNGTQQPSQQKPSTAHVSHNSGDNEWYTPAEYIEAARNVMGSIALDPASSGTANTIVGADTFYSADNNGLKHGWAGTVWMNPPYAQPLVRYFCEKLTQHYAAGEVPEAIVLVNNATETAWFQDMAQHASAICFPRGRVKFWAPDKVSAPLQGQAILYFGGKGARFVECFGVFGLTALVQR